MASGGSRMAGYVETGLVMLLTTDVSKVLAGWAGWDLFMACAALYSVSRHFAPRDDFGRGHYVIENMLEGVMIGVVIRSVSVDEVGLGMANFLCVFLLLSGLDDSRLSGTTQYQFANQVVDNLQVRPCVRVRYSVCVADIACAHAWLISLVHMRG